MGTTVDDIIPASPIKALNSQQARAPTGVLAKDC